ncbi:MAG TPA: peptidase [Thauera sp.]|nr:peptidase [Thauera sp.]HHW63787.1 peptidoglycan DD-metalloendopeptidase family protein [Rhodocyclaceae bacterium]
MHTRTGYLSLLLAALLSAGCASQVTAPVRDGAGGVSTGAVTPAPASGLHTVRPGDTLLGIARQYGVTLPDLVAWNQITDPNQIHVGQTIRVSPAGTSSVAIAAPGSSSAIVTPIPATGGEVGSVPVVREPVGGRAPVAEPTAAETPAPATGETAPAPAPAGSGQWQWPTNGVLVAGFNEASNKGLDIGGSVGDPVYAAAAGKVVYAGSGLRGYGKLIVIKHNQEYNSVYAHNDKLLVKEDDQVAQGQKIAELGSSEADRPKLHFEIRKQGKAVDPMGYLPAR